MLAPSIVVCFVMLVGVPARAETAAVAAKVRLEEQVKALVDDDAAAFAATFRNDGFVMLPPAALEGGGSATIKTLVEKWRARLGKGATFAIDKPQSGNGPTTVGWYAANLVVKQGAKTRTFRMTGIVGSSASGDRGPIDSYSVIALAIGEPIEDAVAIRLATSGKLPVLPSLKVPGYEVRWNYWPERLLHHSYGDHGMAAGSAPKELAFGKAVPALLAQWKSLKLATADQQVIELTDDHNTPYTNIVLAHVDITSTINGKPVRVPFRALFAFNMGSGEEPDVLQVAHFSIATE